MIPKGVTVVIPNWNHELFLPRSISSGLAAVKHLRKNGLDGEVLVVDDRSRDGSYCLLRQLEALYFEDGLRVLALRENKGICEARNEGLRRARYGHVVVMDADNELVPENIIYFHRALKETSAAVVYGNLIIKQWEPGAPSIVSNEPFQKKMFEENYIDAFSMLDRDQVLDRIGGYNPDRRIQAYGDWDLFLGLCSNGARIVFVPIVFGFYYRLPGSMIAEHSKQGDPEDAMIKRMHNQVRARRHMPLRSNHLRYHPDIGYC